MTDVVTLQYWYNFDGEYEIIEKQALVIAPSTVVTANGECLSIEVIEKWTRTALLRSGRR